MPELPEVETIVCALRTGTPHQPAIIERRILDARLCWDRTLADPSAVEFLQRIRGQVIRDISRRGKFLQLRLSTDWLLFHLRMSGDLVVRPSAEPILAHDRLLLALDENLTLAFNDARKFGRVWLVDQPEDVLVCLGPEPLDEALTGEDFFSRLHVTRRQLKPLLLDQAFLAGLGNIYADESLHLAKLHPLTPASSVSPVQAVCLLESIRSVLQEGIRRNGASIDWVYRGGDFQNYFHVYQRTGEPCPDCGTQIARIVVGQRGTHYCPNCQSLERTGGFSPDGGSS